MSNDDRDDDVSQQRTGTSRILLAAAAGASATFALAWASWRLANAPVEDFPAWLEAWATVAAVGAAIVAGLYAAKVFRLEFQRDQRWEEASRATQASRVAAWPLELIYDTETVEDADGLQCDMAIGVRGVTVRVRNASDLPVAQVRIVASAMVGDSQGRREEVRIAARVTSHLDPETTEDVNVLAEAPDALAPLLNQAEPELRIFLQFKDAVGRTWSRRTHEGDLRDAGVRADRTIRRRREGRWGRFHTGDE